MKSFLRAPLTKTSALYSEQLWLCHHLRNTNQWHPLDFFKASCKTRFDLGLHVSDLVIHGYLLRNASR